MLNICSQFISVRTIYLKTIEIAQIFHSETEVKKLHMKSDVQSWSIENVPACRLPKFFFVDT